MLRSRCITGLGQGKLLVPTVAVAYSLTCFIRTLLIRHFRLIRQGNLKTSKPLPLTPMLNQPFNKTPLLVRHKIFAYFSDKLSGSDSILRPVHNQLKATDTPILDFGHNDL